MRIHRIGRVWRQRVRRARRHPSSIFAPLAIGALSVAFAGGIIVPVTAITLRLGASIVPRPGTALRNPDGAVVTSAPGPTVAPPTVPMEETPPQRIACGALDVRYDPSRAPVDIYADVHAVFDVIALALERPVTYSGATTGVQVSIQWNREISPAAGRTIFPTSHVIGEATIELNPGLDLPPGDVPGGWRVALLHEGGHAMGLAHENGPAGGVMVPVFDDSVAPLYTPAQIAAIRWAGSSPDCRH